MKLIKSSVTNITPNRFFEEDILKHIELCGRTCYKSEDRITDTSAEKFVNMLKKNKHRSVLEHGTVYLYTRETSYNFMGVWRSDLFDKYDKNPYSVAYMDGPEVYITTNYRVIIENGWESDLDFIDDEFGMFHVQRYTFSITCSRAIANEIVRHRAMSFSQESTRYCNYANKNKFGSDLQFIIPSRFVDIIPEGYAYKNGNWRMGLKEQYSVDLPVITTIPDSLKVSHKECYIIEKYLDTLHNSEYNYKKLSELGLKPEEARGVLPLDLKTDLIVTGTLDQWKEFFELRCAKSAHPDVQVIANKIKKYIYEPY